jgi:hypothetical protein
MLNKPPRWSNSSGWPTLHAVQSAMQVALILGPEGSLQVEASESYWKHSGGGTFGPVDFGLGEQLLLDTGIIERRGPSLVPLIDLGILLDGDQGDVVAFICSRISPDLVESKTSDRALEDLISDSERRAEVLGAMSRKFDDTMMRIVGQIGEELVVSQCRQELRKLGRTDLARKVRQVSLNDDGAGYDIVAPRISGANRLLEVKATTSDVDPLAFYVSRNEATVGLDDRSWALIACVNVNVGDRSGEILGWIPGLRLAQHLPQDSLRGSWQSAKLEIPRDEFNPGMPSAIQ